MLDERGREPGPPRWWGAAPGRLGITLIALGAALGALCTILAGAEPGTLLGLFVVVATLIGGLAVRPGAVYQVVPVPALAYLAAAAIAGIAHDHAAATSRTALAVDAAQWAASGFLLMCAATLLAVALTVARRPRRNPRAGWAPALEAPRSRRAGPPERRGGN